MYYSEMKNHIVQKARKNFAAKAGGNFIERHLHSQRFAWLGLFSIFREEPNFRIELLAAVIVIFLSILLQISLIKFLVLILTVASVLMAEIVNSIVERICDIYTSEHHVGIKFIKDVAAGGVLLMAIFSLVIGGIVFGPEIFRLL